MSRATQSNTRSSLSTEVHWFSLSSPPLILRVVQQTTGKEASPVWCIASYCVSFNRQKRFLFRTSIPSNASIPLLCTIQREQRVQSTPVKSNQAPLIPVSCLWLLFARLTFSTPISSTSYLHNSLRLLHIWLHRWLQELKMSSAKSSVSVVHLLPQYCVFKPLLPQLFS